MPLARCHLDRRTLVLTAFLRPAAIQIPAAPRDLWLFLFIVLSVGIRFFRPFSVVAT